MNYIWRSAAVAFLLSAAPAFGAIVVNEVWPQPDDEYLGRMPVSDNLSVGVSAYDDEDFDVEPTYAWTATYYPDYRGQVQIDLSEYEGWNGLEFVPGEDPFQGAGTYQIWCEVGGGNAAPVLQGWEITVVGDEPEGPIFVSTVEDLRDALWTAAISGEPSEVVVRPGTYVLDQELWIWPNTTLTLEDGATMLSAPGTEGYMLNGRHWNTDENGDDIVGSTCYVDGCTHGGYSQCHDVVVRGGVWDRNSSGAENSKIFVFRHASGITVSNTVATSCCNHFFNFSGSEDVTVDNVVFSDAVRYTGDDPDFWVNYSRGDADRFEMIEAVHLDFMDKVGESGGRPLDGTPCRNVLVTNCLFDSVFSGVGTHHYPSAGAATGIKVVDCEFRDMLSYAVYCFGFSGAVVSGCTVEGSAGLLDCKNASCTATGNSCAGATMYPVFAADGADVTLRDNTFTDASSVAILVRDGSKLAASGNLVNRTGANAVVLIGSMADDFSSNEIRGAGAIGLLAMTGSTLVAKKNKIVSAGTHGISTSGGSKLTASGNTVSSPVKNGFYLDGGTASMSGDKVTSPGQAGVCAANSAKATVSNMTISKAGTHGITIGSGCTLTASGNTITSPKQYGILLQSAKSSSIRTNTITGSTANGIRLNTSNGCTVAGNTVTSSKAEGIVIDRCKSGTIADNVVTKTSSHAIRLVGTKAIPTTVTVKNNTFSTAKPSSCFDIRLGDYCKNCQILKNTLANKRYSVSKTGSSGNKYQPVPTKITKKSRSKDKKSITIGWQKQAYATGYQIQYATNSSFKSAKTVTVSSPKTVSTVVKKLAAKQKYWFRVRTYQTLGGTKYYSGWSSTVTVAP